MKIRLLLRVLVSGIFAAAFVYGQNVTSTTLTSSPNPSTYGQNVVLTATISPSSATGTISFYADSNPIAIGTSNVSGGTAILSTSTLTVGPHQLQAFYSGDANNAGSLSTRIQQFVVGTLNAPNVTAAVTAPAAGTCPSLPPGQSAFLTTDNQVWFDFTYTGGNASDQFAVEFIEPSGAVYTTDTFMQTNSGGSYCYQYFIGIAGFAPASFTGTWTTELFWNGTPIYSVSFSIEPQSQQAITFAPLGNVTLGIAPFTLSATASSGLPVAFASTTSAVCTVSANIVTILATGMCTITASQAGNNFYSVASPVTRSFTVDPPEVITTTALPNGILNQQYAPFTLTATQGTGTYAWSATVATLPSGLSLSAAGVLTGTPTVSGNYFVAVSVTSGGATVSATLPLIVLAQALPLQIPGGGVAPVPLPGGMVANPYSQGLPVINGIPPYSWSMLGGALPRGLTLSPTGTLAGTPMQAGIAEFTAKVKDASGSSASAVFIITTAPQSLTFTTLSPLSSAIAGSDYPPQILTATGGTAPYTFQITGGALPGGLTLSGSQIGGIPAVAGSSTFTVTATDSGSPPQTASAQFQLAVQPKSTDLILAQGSLAFSLNTGATGLPPGVNVPVGSSAVSQVLGYSVSVSSSVTWLDVTPGGFTPGAIGVSIDPKALSLGAGAYQASVVVTCASASPCAGNSQTISVYLTVTAVPPQLTIANSLLSFSAQTSGPPPLPQTLSLQNTGGGTITVNSITATSAFVTIGNVPSTIPAGPSVPVTVTVNPSLAAGYYQSTIVVNTSAGTASVPVTMFLAQNPIVTLNPAGAQFLATAGAPPGNLNGSFLVSVPPNTILNWNATLLPGASWLQLNTSGGTSTSASPGSISYSINPGVAASLAPQAYYGLIQVVSGNAVDSPLTFLVILNVAPATTPVKPDPEPGGLLFIATGIGAPMPQTVQVFASSQTPIVYQATSDSPWLQVTLSTGNTSAAAPAQSNVFVNLSGLAAGVYRGNVSYAFSGSAVRSVNVTLIVEPAAAGSSERPRAICQASQLIPAEIGLVNNFAQPAAWPAQLAVLLFDNCGNPITNGEVVATFSNGDSPLALSPTDTVTGIYSGTWTPRNSSANLAIAVSAVSPAFPAATVQLTGQVTPNAAPLLTPNGALNAFAISAEPGVPVAPGTIVQIYGSNLAAQATSASTIPLPTSLNQTSVFIGGLLAPLYYVSPGQINAQVPFELLAGRTYQVYVSANGAISSANPIQLTNDAPGVAQFASGQIIATHSDGITLITETSPARPGEYVVVYVAGMGLTNQSVASGTASPSTPFATVIDAPAMTLGGIPVTGISFSGLTPTLVGLYQINFVVPTNVPNGDLPLTLTQTSGVSNSAVLSVHN